MADPIKWGKGREAAFVAWIDQELQDGINAREPLVQQWLRWLEMYRAPAKQPIKNFPFEGASNAMLPLIATDVDQLYAKFIQTIHAPPNLWTLQALNERWGPRQGTRGPVESRLLRVAGEDRREVSGRPDQVGQRPRIGVHCVD